MNYSLVMLSEGKSQFEKQLKQIEREIEDKTKDLSELEERKEQATKAIADFNETINLLEK